jgi:serine/threonine protein phosphatase PrpC
MLVYETSLIGKRTTNEDQHHIILNGNNNDSKLNNINFFAVYDGHGGNKVSKFLKSNLSQYFLKKNIQYPLSDSYIIKVFDHLQKKLAIDHKDFAYSQGSTCLILINYFINNKNYIHVCNLGDCRAVICSNGLANYLTRDHKPDWPLEKLRINQLGGEIIHDGFDYRICNMSVSRSFGDIDASPYVTHIPDIFKYKISQDDQFVIMACDGLWDVVSNHEAVNFVQNFVDIKKNKNCKKEVNTNKNNIIIKDGRINIAKSLAEYAIQKGSADNITIIIIFL